VANKREISYRVNQTSTRVNDLVLGKQSQRPSITVVGTVCHLITALKQFVKQNERYLLTRLFLSVADCCLKQYKKLYGTINRDTVFLNDNIHHSAAFIFAS